MLRCDLMNVCFECCNLPLNLPHKGIADTSLEHYEIGFVLFG